MCIRDRVNHIKETERVKQIYNKDVNQIEDLYYSYYHNEYTKEGYIKSGLVLQYDGIDTTGNGHDANTCLLYTSVFY